MMSGQQMPEKMTIKIKISASVMRSRKAREPGEDLGDNCMKYPVSK